MSWPLALAFAWAAGAGEFSLLPDLRALRDCSKSLARVDTAYDPVRYARVIERGGYPLTEHCGAVAMVVWTRFGGRVLMGRYRAPDGRETLHVFNRLPAGDFDLTKAQFGLPEDADDLKPPEMADVREISAEELWANSRLRRFLNRYEVAQEKATRLNNFYRP